MRDRLTQKQETFTQNLFKGMYQRDAYIDAYKPAYALSTIDANASRLANNAKVLTRWEELKLKVEDSTVANVLERKQRLTEFTREDIISEKSGVIVRTGNIAAIDTLNKMEKIYTDGATVNIDNRKVEIIVSGEAAKKLTEQIVKGEGT